VHSPHNHRLLLLLLLRELLLLLLLQELLLLLEDELLLLMICLTSRVSKASSERRGASPHLSIFKVRQVLGSQLL
jgi:hypothetical protein